MAEIPVIEMENKERLRIKVNVDDVDKFQKRGFEIVDQENEIETADELEAEELAGNEIITNEDMDEEIGGQEEIEEEIPETLSTE